MTGTNARAIMGAVALMAITLAAVFAAAPASDAADPVSDGEVDLYGYYITMGLVEPDQVETVEWDFGDGTDHQTVTISAGNPTGKTNHTYASKGDYTVTATMRNTYTDSDGNEKSGESVLKWIYHVHGYPVIKFESRGGSPVEPIEGGSASFIADPPTEPANGGLTFDGWYTDAKCTQRFDWSKEVTYSMVLYAGWSGNAHTVTFDPDNGESFSIQVADGKTVACPEEDPSKDGKTFAGWYLGDSEYDFGLPVTEDITLKAHWAGGSGDVLKILGIVLIVLAVICGVAFWLSGIILFAVPAPIFLILGIVLIVLGM